MKQRELTPGEEAERDTPFTDEEMDDIRRSPGLYGSAYTVRRLMATIDARQMTPVTRDDAISLIAEGVHTGLRKGSDAPLSGETWRAIQRDNSGWEDAVAFAIDGLEYMGYVICKKPAGAPKASA